MSVYLCDPTWHKGNRSFPARYFVRAAGRQRSPLEPGFACCEAHLGRATRHMMTTYGWASVEVRDLSGRAEHAAAQAAAAAEG